MFFNGEIGISAVIIEKFIYMHLWLRLGIARSNKFVGLCTRLAQTFPP